MVSVEGGEAGSLFRFSPRMKPRVQSAVMSSSEASVSQVQSLALSLCMSYKALPIGGPTPGNLPFGLTPNQFC